MFKCMLKIIFIFSFLISASCTAYAVCEHNFECDKYKTNLIRNDDMTHSCYCLHGCGSYGTVNGGIYSKEECILFFLSENEPTCTEEGTRFYICTVCYRSVEEKIPKKEHRYTSARRLPTCTQSGYDIHVCSECDESYTDNTVQPVAHISDGGVLEVMPDFNKIGLLKISCRVCNTVIERKTVPELISTAENACTPEAVRKFRVKAYSVTSVKLTWEKSEYALSYRVYYSTDKKKWKSVSSVRTSLTVNKLKPARKYYFKICAVGDEVTGAESKIISVCTTPKKAVLREVVSAEKSAVTVKWEKQSNVSGYEISYSLHKFSKRKNTEKYSVSKGTKKTIKKLNSGKKYYFRIRAYKKFGSKKVYGAYSDTKTVKIR